VSPAAPVAETAADDDAAPGPPEPTPAEIARLASRARISEPIARELLRETTQTDLPATDRERLLDAMASDFNGLLGQLQQDAGDDAAAQSFADQTSAALQAADFATARAAISEEAARLDADPNGSDPLYRAALNAQAGQIALLEGRNDKAAVLFQTALGGVPGNEALLLARFVGLLGLAQLRSGDFDDARTNLEQAVRLRKAHLGNGHPDLAAALEQLAGCYRAEGKYGNAEKLYLRALTIWQREAAERTLEISRAEVQIRDLQRLQGKTSADG
jgi:hypothetical protein